MAGPDSTASGDGSVARGGSASGAPVARIAHLSDVHFGKISHPAVVSALVDEVNAGDFTLVVISGDITQRATKEQFKQARAMIWRFEAPVLVVPGNHDVRAWWHDPLSRVFRSARQFKTYISDDETPSFDATGLAAFGLNSAHGLTIKGGKIRERHLVEMRAYFEQAASGAFRVLVLHHHLLRLEALGDHDVARGARHALEEAEAADVDLVLCGHLHRSHIANVELAPKVAGTPGHSLVIASAGTATSSRGRGDNRATNFYNWITVAETAFTIHERRFDPVHSVFAPERETTFDRT